MKAPAAGHPGSTYAVKRVETVADGTDVRVRLFTLAPGEIIPWHYHSQCADHYFVLGGTLTVETHNPEELHTINVGERHRLQPGTVHQISNRSEEDCRFVLVQGVGAPDWIKARAE